MSEAFCRYRRSREVRDVREVERSLPFGSNTSTSMGGRADKFDSDERDTSVPSGYAPFSTLLPSDMRRVYDGFRSFPMPVICTASLPCLVLREAEGVTLTRTLGRVRVLSPDLPASKYSMSREV